MMKTRLNRQKQDIMRIKSQSGDVSRTPTFFNSGSTKNFYEPPEKSIQRQDHSETPIFVLKATFGPLWFRFFQCNECKFWSGGCSKGKINKIAISTACEKFEHKRCQTWLIM